MRLRRRSKSPWPKDLPAPVVAPGGSILEAAVNAANQKKMAEDEIEYRRRTRFRQDADAKIRKVLGLTDVAWRIEQPRNAASLQAHAVIEGLKIRYCEGNAAIFRDFHPNDYEGINSLADFGRLVQMMKDTPVPTPITPHGESKNEIIERFTGG